MQLSYCITVFWEVKTDMNDQNCNGSFIIFYKGYPVSFDLFNQEVGGKYREAERQKVNSTSMETLSLVLEALVFHVYVSKEMNTDLQMLFLF